MRAGVGRRVDGRARVGIEDALPSPEPHKIMPDPRIDAYGHPHGRGQLGARSETPGATRETGPARASD